MHQVSTREINLEFNLPVPQLRITWANEPPRVLEPGVAHAGGVDGRGQGGEEEEEEDGGGEGHQHVGLKAAFSVRIICNLSPLFCLGDPFLDPPAGGSPLERRSELETAPSLSLYLCEGKASPLEKRVHY